MEPRREPNSEDFEKASVRPPGDRDTTYPGGVGRATGGRYDVKRDPPFPEAEPPYAGDPANLDYDASRQGGDAQVRTTNSGVDNSNVDEFTTGGNSLGKNAGASRDNASSVSDTVHDSGRRPDQRSADRHESG
jgi:hypothetical protein